MRGLFTFIWFIIAAAIVAVLAIFAVQNIFGVPVHFLGYAFTGNIWWITVGAAVLGFLLAFILLVPGRIAASWRGRTLRREHEQMQQQLAGHHAEYEQLEREHMRLRSEYQQLATERDRLRARPVAPTARAAAAEGTPVAGAPVAGAPSASAPRTAVPATPVAQPAQPAEPAVSSVIPPDRVSATSATAASFPEEETTPPTRGERVREAPGRQPRPEEMAAEEDRSRYPQGPTVPTT
jgi:uncharacterized integral membrane protein